MTTPPGATTAITDPGPVIVTALEMITTHPMMSVSDALANAQERVGDSEEEK